MKTGWKRLAIVLSIVWLVGAFVHFYNESEHYAIFMATETTDTCIEGHNGPDPDNVCLHKGEDTMRRERVSADKLGAACFGHRVSHATLGPLG